MFYRYSDERKANLECFLVALAVGHLGCCTTSTWLTFVLLALLYVWGFTYTDFAASKPTAKVAFLLGLLVAWVASATLASLAVLLYSWNRRRRPARPKPGGFCSPSNALCGRPTTLSRCCSDIERLVNLDTVTPILYQNGVLNTEDVTSLVNTRAVSGATRSYQVLRLVTILDSKGEKGFEGVVDALKEDKEHMGHEELADILTLKHNEDHRGRSQLKHHKPAIYKI